MEGINQKHNLNNEVTFLFLLVFNFVRIFNTLLRSNKSGGHKKKE